MSKGAIDRNLTRAMIGEAVAEMMNYHAPEVLVIKTGKRTYAEMQAAELIVNGMCNGMPVELSDECEPDMVYIVRRELLENDNPADLGGAGLPPAEGRALGTGVTSL